MMIRELFICKLTTYAYFVYIKVINQVLFKLLITTEAHLNYSVEKFL
jgi:hypothetical protein